MHATGDGGAMAGRVDPIGKWGAAATATALRSRNLVGLRIPLLEHVGSLGPGDAGTGLALVGLAVIIRTRFVVFTLSDLLWCFLPVPSAFRLSSSRRLRKTRYRPLQNPPASFLILARPPLSIVTTRLPLTLTLLCSNQIACGTATATATAVSSF